MSEHMVRRDLRWRLYFTASWLLGFGVMVVLVALRLPTQPHLFRIVKGNAIRHADIYRTGGPLDPMALERERDRAPQDES